MRIDSGFVEPFDFAAVGARQPTSRARVLEVPIQSPPPDSPRTIGSSAPVFHRAPAAVAPMIVGHDVIFRGAGGRKRCRQEDRGRVYGRDVTSSGEPLLKLYVIAVGVADLAN